jgi:hypothetical protein
MRRLYFEEPVVVWLVRDRHELGVRRVRDVHDGLAALHRYGIETLKGDGRPCREWRAAAASLLRAAKEPTPGHLARARDSLSRAAAKVGALSVPDPLGVLADRGYDFAP